MIIPNKWNNMEQYKMFQTTNQIHLLHNAAWDGTIAAAVTAHGGRAICTTPAKEANALPSATT